MTDAESDPRAPGGDDLFDLPSEAKAKQEAWDWAAGAPDVDQPSSALPRRPESTRPAGPPLTTVESSVAGILSEVRKRNDSAEEAGAEVEAPTSPAPRAKFRPSRRMWMAFGAVALISAVVLISLSLRARTTTPDSPAVDEHAAAAQPTPSAQPMHSAPIAHVPEPAPAPAQPVAAHAASPVVKSTAPAVDSGAALEAARQSLLAAREEIATGRRGAARARLGRIGLAIDALPAAEREPLRAEVALVVAQTIQADADQAARSQP